MLEGIPPPRPSFNPITNITPNTNITPKKLTPPTWVVLYRVSTARSTSSRVRAFYTAASSAPCCDKAPVSGLVCVASCCAASSAFASSPLTNADPTGVLFSACNCAAASAAPACAYNSRSIRFAFATDTPSRPAFSIADVSCACRLSHATAHTVPPFAAAAFSKEVTGSPDAAWRTS